jgi:hypothetical protein
MFFVQCEALLALEQRHPAGMHPYISWLDYFVVDPLLLVVLVYN